MRQTTAKRKPATETCLFCGRKIPDRSNAETIREFVQRFKRTARKTTLTEFNTVRVMSYSISPQELDTLADEMIRENVNDRKRVPIAVSLHKHKH